MALPTNGSPFDLVRGQKMTNTGGTYTVRQKGMSLRATGATGGFSIPLDMSSANIISVAMWLYWDTNADVYSMALEFTTIASNPGAWSVLPNSSATLGKSRWQITAGTAINGWTITRPTAAKWHHWVMTADCSADPAVATWYIDGQLAPGFAINGAAVTPNGNFANSTLYMMYRDGGGAPSLFAVGNIQDLLVYNRVLSAQEAWQLYSNTNQIYEPANVLRPALLTTNFRKTLSSIGSRTGARQAHGW